jgi:hypothetical protein
MALLLSDVSGPTGQSGKDGASQLRLNTVTVQ